jgi:hypothetical protein
MMMQAKMMMLTTKIVTPERVHWFPTMMWPAALECIIPHAVLNKSCQLV